MNPFPKPDESNAFLAPHIAILRDCFRHWTGRDMVPARMTGREAARYVFQAKFALLSHDTSPDPLFNYANEVALGLFAMDWSEFIGLPSRYSAESAHREERGSILEAVRRDGFVDDYSGIRIGRRGRRFLIEQATVWTLSDADGKPYGQAALIPHWRFL